MLNRLQTYYTEVAQLTDTIIIPTPVMAIPFFCLTNKKDFILNGPESIQDYRLAMPYGAIAIKNYAVKT